LTVYNRGREKADFIEMDRVDGFLTFKSGRLYRQTRDPELEALIKKAEEML